MSTVSASEAGQTLPAQLDRVEGGEEVSITRHGRVVAVLVRPDVLVARRAATAAAIATADRIGEMLDRARHQPLPTAGIEPDRAEELVREIALGRSER